MSYEERLCQLELPTLAFRRHRGDIVELFKLYNSYESEPGRILSLAKDNITRGHKYKLYKEFSKTRRRASTFSRRIVAPWNKLPEEIVLSTNINTFKNKLDHYWRRHELKYSWEGAIDGRPPAHVQPN